MARTPSNMVPLGTPAPAFALPDAASGLQTIVSLEDFAAKPVLLVMFICNHCPFVVHVAPALARLARAWQERGVAVVAISSNDVDKYPQDGPGAMQMLAAELNLSFPYLLDVDQGVAKAYQAACTPDFFVYNAQRELVYRGQLDGSRPGNGVPVTGADLDAALEAALSGGPPVADQIASIGCNIKWIAGKEPAWFG